LELWNQPNGHKEEGIDGYKSDTDTENTHEFGLERTEEESKEKNKHKSSKVPKFQSSKVPGLTKKLSKSWDPEKEACKNHLKKF
jgi:hypothetical protein